MEQLTITSLSVDISGHFIIPRELGYIRQQLRKI